MITQANGRFFQLSGTQPAAASLSADRIIHLDARFERAGVWSGVSELLEEAYQDLDRRGKRRLFDAYNYELHMALPGRRAEIPLKYACLTDAAIGAERTRNFPLDRAFRIVNGLVSFVQRWKALYEGEQWTVVVRNFSSAQYLARRFFTELARRLIDRKVTVYVETSTGAGMLDVTELVERLHLPRVEQTLLTDEACAYLESTATQTMECWERIYPALLAYYRDRQDGLSAARVALRAICLYNHYGYYHESSSFAATVLPHFEALVGDDENARWNYIGNIFQGLVTTGQEQDALRLVEEQAMQRLTQSVLRAKMHYLLAMIHARYLKPHDIGAAERHILAAVDELESARPTLATHEYAFLRVFIHNGLAFVRVRQKRMQEALDLCESGFEFLSAELGDDKHRLHRSVLLYNSAQVYVFLGKHEEALAAYNQAMQMDPYYSEYYNESANLLQQLGRHEAAVANYDKAIRYSAPYPEVYYNKAVCHSRMGQLQQALEAFAHSEELNPLQPELYLARAEVLDELCRTDDAYADYSKAIELAPDSITARVNRAVLCYNRADFTQALADMDHAIAIDPDETSHYENRAAIYEALGHAELAQLDMQKAEEVRRAA